MRLRLRRPTDDQVAHLLRSQADQPFSYREVGATRGPLPRGYDHAEHQVDLGRGDASFAAAREAVRSWRMFDIAWLELHGRDIAPSPGVCVAPIVRALMLWTVNVARVVYVVDEVDRFGFAYGTLPHHTERGEELFLVGRDPDGSVWYRIKVFSRPGPCWARWAKPIVVAHQRRFRVASGRAMRRAVLPATP